MSNRKDRQEVLAEAYLIAEIANIEIAEVANLEKTALIWKGKPYPRDGRWLGGSRRSLKKAPAWKRLGMEILFRQDLPILIDEPLYKEIPWVPFDTEVWEAFSSFHAAVHNSIVRLHKGGAWVPDPAIMNDWNPLGEFSLKGRGHDPSKRIPVALPPDGWGKRRARCYQGPKKATKSRFGSPNAETNIYRFLRYLTLHLPDNAWPFRDCPVCGNLFVHRTVKRFCSPKCTRKNQRSRQTPEQRQNKTEYMREWRKKAQAPAQAAAACTRARESEHPPISPF